MSERAQKLAAFLLEGGMEAYDYSPEDLQRYQQLAAEQARMRDANSIVDRTSGDFSQDWTRNWTEYERLRNRYNGMPPRQLNQQQPTQPAHAATPGPKYSFYPSMGGPSNA